MNDPLNAATAKRAEGWGKGPEDQTRTADIIDAWLRAVVACRICGGTGLAEGKRHTGMKSDTVECPGPHVEIEVPAQEDMHRDFVEILYANPNRIDYWFGDRDVPLIQVSLPEGWRVD